MDVYRRTTRECPVSQWRPELRQAIQDYVREHQLGDVESEALICCETVAQKKHEGGLLSWLNGMADTTVHTGTLLTPQWLIWAWSGDRSGVGLSAARLMDIRVRTQTSARTRETGLEVAGYIGDSTRRVRGIIALGADRAAEKFCQAVEDEIAKAHPPRKKGFLSRLFGG